MRIHRILPLLPKRWLLLQLVVWLSVSLTLTRSFVHSPPTIRVTRRRISPAVTVTATSTTINNMMLSSSPFRYASTTGSTTTDTISLYSKNTDNSPESSPSRLDDVLSRLTSAFPLFVASAATLAVYRPQTLLWVNQGGLISSLLAAVMCGTGLTLTKQDFESIVLSKKRFVSVILGVVCQFGIMPLAAWSVGRSLLLSSSVAASSSASSSAVGPALFLGICLVGCSPGGTASNLVSLIAQADVALSVILTACSTLLAVVATPLLVKLLVGSSISINGMALVQATARVVFLPVLLGMVMNAKAPKLSRTLSRFTPFLSVLIVSLICGGVVAQTVPLLASTSTAGQALTTRVGIAVSLMHTLGFAMGYFIPKYSFRQSEKTSRTIAIEVGMQNSALAVVLARSLNVHPLAALPGALSATAHSCLGSMLAAYWRMKQPTNNESSDATE